MKNLNSQIDLTEVRKEYSKAPKFSADNTHEAYIVKLWVNSKRYVVGVSYWTKEEIVAGVKTVNNTKHEIVAPLYEN